MVSAHQRERQSQRRISCAGRAFVDLLRLHHHLAPKPSTSIPSLSFPTRKPIQVSFSRPWPLQTDTATTHLLSSRSTRPDLPPREDRPPRARRPDLRASSRTPRQASRLALFPKSGTSAESPERRRMGAFHAALRALREGRGTRRRGVGRSFVARACHLC